MKDVFEMFLNIQLLLDSHNTVGKTRGNLHLVCVVLSVRASVSFKMKSLCSGVTLERSVDRATPSVSTRSQFFFVVEEMNAGTTSACDA